MRVAAEGFLNDIADLVTEYRNYAGDGLYADDLAQWYEDFAEDLGSCCVRLNAAAMHQRSTEKGCDNERN